MGFKMKIGIITPSVSPGGLYRVAIEETKNLSRMGFETKLISLIKPQNPWVEKLQEINLKYLKNYKILTPTISEIANRNLFIFKKISDEFDILICHNIPSCFIAYRIRDKNKKIKMIAYIHDPIQFTLTGNLFQLLFRVNYIKKALATKWLKNFDIILVNSKRSQRILKRETGLDSEVLYPTTIPSATKTPPIRRSKFFLTVGRIGEHPTYPLLLEILKKTENMKLLIAGSWSYTASRIVKLFSQGNIKERVKFVFNPSDDKLRRLYLHARGFLYPGVENFNMSALEAASNACPIICSKESGIAELFEKYPLLAYSRDINAFVEIVAKLRDDENKAIRYGKIAWHIARKYNLEYHMRNLIKILEEIF
jgi:glycosyltransferase involved in cell wall biosynthesis